MGRYLFTVLILTTNVTVSSEKKIDFIKAKQEPMVMGSWAKIYFLKQCGRFC